MLILMWVYPPPCLVIIVGIKFDGKAFLHKASREGIEGKERCSIRERSNRWLSYVSDIAKE